MDEYLARWAQIVIDDSIDFGPFNVWSSEN
jgi:hypothetical protein